MLHLFVVFSVVYANTETILFEHFKNSQIGNDFIEPMQPYTSVFTFNETTKINKLQLKIRTKNRYFARVCWPASSAADFSLEYVDGALNVIGSRAGIVDLNDLNTIDVDFNVHLSELWLGVPVDVWPMVVSILLVFVTGCLFAYIFV